MAPKNETDFTIEDMKTRLQQLDEIASDLRNSIALAERYGIAVVRATNGDQFRRALLYMVNFAAAFKRGTMTTLGQPKDSES